MNTVSEKLSKTDMKIQITSYVHGLSDKVRLNLTADIINNANVDLLLFCGYTIGFMNDIDRLQSKITNSKSEIVFELKSINSSKINNCLYYIKEGGIINLYTNQIFTQSKEIEGNYELADRFLHELETKRIIKIKGFSFLIIQCGEINILRNIQSADNEVEFRFTDDPILSNRFNKLLSEANVILNPIHTPMGNQGKMHKRRQFLSSNGRYYFSTSNTKNDSIDLELKSLQYAYGDGKDLIEIEKNITEKSISRIYEI